MCPGIGVTIISIIAVIIIAIDWYCLLLIDDWHQEPPAPPRPPLIRARKVAPVAPVPVPASQTPLGRPGSSPFYHCQYASAAHMATPRGGRFLCSFT
jgi:hypothetical protein